MSCPTFEPRQSDNQAAAADVRSNSGTADPLKAIAEAIEPLANAKPWPSENGCEPLTVSPGHNATSMGPLAL
jgi:hypothetical protein